MTAVSDLYQDLILDHNASPRNFGELTSPTHRAEGVNPLCGDQLVLFLDIKDDLIRDVRFVGTGCAISRASASLMTGALKGKTVPEAEDMFDAFHDMVVGQAAEHTSNGKLGKLNAFAGVREFPSRVKCATLAWHTLKAALQQKNTLVSTE